jgi:hypothetical protein
LAAWIPGVYRRRFRLTGQATLHHGP